MNNTISRALHVVAFVISIGRRPEFDRSQVSAADYDRAAWIAAEADRRAGAR